MIEYKRGDILAENAEALVNSVNCVGIMGRGVALQFKRAFPANFKAYEIACRHGEVEPGRMFVFETGLLGHPRYIINFPTKRHWRGNSRMEDIDSGLAALVREVEHRGIRSIAIPPLGSGLGGLEWAQVRGRIERAIEKLADVRVIVFEPYDAPAVERAPEVGNVPRMTPGRAALVGLIYRYLGGLLDPFVTLLEVHKLMYFMQECGEILKLRYVPGLYGPYADNLRHVLRHIEGYYVSGYADGGDAPDRSIQLVPGAAAEAMRFLEAHPETQARFERVQALVEGFETPFGLELLSTVHWVVTHNETKALDDVVQQVYAWGPRKHRFSRQQISLALRVLGEQGWLGRTSLVAAAS